MSKNQKYEVKEIYDAHDIRIVEYTHKNRAKTLRAFYQGKSSNQNEVLKHISKYQSEIAEAIYSNSALQPNESLDSYLSRTDNEIYVDNLGSSNNNGVILGAYIPAKDKKFILRNIPYSLIDAINNVRGNQLEHILGESAYHHKKKISANDIRKFARAHETAHRRRLYTDESQNEEEVDLEAAVLTGEYPIIRFPSVLRDMHNPYIKEEILKRPGIDYVRRAA